MATYFHGAPEIQTDGLQTLYLMNPGYGGYSADAAAAAASTNMVFLNSAVATLNPAGISHHQQQQHFVGIPLQPQVAAPAQDPDSSRPMSIHDMSAATGVHGLLPRLQNNLWSPNPANSLGNLTSPLGLRRPSELLSGQQGLSLSLSPQQPSYMYRLEPEMQPPAPPVISPTGEEAVRFSTSTSSAASGATSNGVPALQSVLMGSKYLKAAQQLLDEVVSVGKGVKDHESPKSAKTSPTKAGKGAEEDGGDDANGKRAVAELTTAERQELQMKKAKLVNMLDEVEQRYRQYHHQMQIVISSFEAIAGVGSARTYTALALRTISKQFRCLRDAITGQIRATSKNMGEDDCLVGSRSEGGSRLRFVDHHLRQQRALQQLGMMQHNAWRPQRGLPERSVFVLRAWLFEHFLHPYPKDADKHMLAKQTGLTRNQVSNWFINARVRLWKPMVEEMYLEETKEHEQQQNNGEDKASTSEAANDDSSSKSSAPPPNGSPTRTEQSEDFKARQDHLQTDHSQPPAGVAMPSPSSTSIRFPPHFYHDHSNTDDMIQFNLKRQRSNASDPVSHHQTSMTLPMTLEMDLKPEDTSNSELFMRFGDIMRAGDEQSFSLLTPGENNGAYAAYPMGDIGPFAPRYGGNGVSLTLGLPQGSYLSSDTIAMGRRLEMSTEANDYFSSNNDSNNGNNSNHTPPVSHSPNAYDNLSIQNRKRFPAQLLPDFVA